MSDERFLELFIALDSKLEKLITEQAGMRTELTEVRTEQLEMKKALDRTNETVTEVKLQLENDIRKQLGLLMDTQVDIIDKFHKLDWVEETLLTVKSDVEVIKSAVTHNSDEIHKLKAVK